MSPQLLWCHGLSMMKAISSNNHWDVEAVGTSLKDYPRICPRDRRKQSGEPMFGLWCKAGTHPIWTWSTKQSQQQCLVDTIHQCSSCQNFSTFWTFIIISLSLTTKISCITTNHWTHTYFLFKNCIVEEPGNISGNMRLHLQVQVTLHTVSHWRKPLN